MTSSRVHTFKLDRLEGRVLLEFQAAVPSTPGAADHAGSSPAVTRVALTPQAAGRLAATLGELLGNGTGGPAGSAPQAGKQSVELDRTTHGRTPVNAPNDPAGEKAALLMKRVSDLGTLLRHERSFRLSDGLLLANRFLLTVRKLDFAGDLERRSLAICREFGMPDAAAAAAAPHFADAVCVHFGFEASAGTIMCKLYLERPAGEAEIRRAKAASEAVPLHVAFKWNVAGAEAAVVTRYLWHPDLSYAAICSRLERIYGSAGSGASFAIAQAVLKLANERVPTQRLQYLEVTEDGSPRRSFDINLYDAQLLVRDLQPMLYAMRDHFSVRPGQFQAVYDQVKSRSMGHLAGGLHRDGKHFFNVYFGVAARAPDR